MATIAQVSGNSVRQCVAAARKHLNVKLQESRELYRSGGEDGLYRVYLPNDIVVECTMTRRQATSGVTSFTE